MADPVLHSEYVAEIPGYFNYVRMKTSSRPFDVNTTDEVARPGVDARRFRWVMKEVPALREEPFMTTPDDYRAAIKFQLSSYHFPGQISSTKVMNTWQQLAEDLAEHRWFGKQLESTGDVRRQTEQVLAGGGASPQEQMIALYDYVRRNLTWTGKRTVFADRSLDDVLKAKKGSSAELAMLLTVMLRETGLEADPVLISTRDNGRVMQEYPMVSQFNDLLVRTEAGGKSFLLAPTDPARSHDLLPPAALNRRGWLMNRDNPRWVKLQTPRRYRRRLLLRGRLTPNGQLEGTIEASDEAYAALRGRHALDEKEVEEFARDDLFAERDDALINAVTVENEKKATQPLKTVTDFTIPAYAQVAGDYLYASPFPVLLLSENPLRLPDRTFPLNLNFPHDLTYTLNLKLPDGYVVEDLPEAVNTHLAGGGASFSRRISAKNGTVMMRVRYVLARSLYPARDYDRMRALFDEVISAQDGQIVLRRAGEQ